MFKDDTTDATKMRPVSQSFRPLLFALLLCLGLTARGQSPHAPLDTILRSSVVDGKVNYGAIGANPAFAAYLQFLAEPRTHARQGEKLAHWINAYNAFVIKGILDGRSPGSLLRRQAFFKLAKYRLDGVEISLDTLEHKMIRPLADPRIHFAVVCAALSCPPLRAEAYTEERLDSQLEESGRNFVNDPNKNRFDKSDRTAHLSEIFKWFAEDFDKSAGSVQKFVAKYVHDPQVAKELAQDGYKVKYLTYDWSLNGTPP